MDASLSSACADALLRSSIRSEFRSWVRTTEASYSYLTTRATRFCTLSVEWQPEKQVNAEGNAVHGLLLGGADCQGPNLALGRWTQTETQEREFVSADLDLSWATQLPGDVNRARLMPQLPSVAAVQSASSVAIHTLRTNEPSLRLVGQNKEGFGLDWNTKLAGMLLSAAYDKAINLWDVQLATALSRRVSPVRTWDTVSEPEDIAWSPHSATFFLAVDRLGRLMQFDSRRKQGTGTVQAHAGMALSVDVNKLEQSLVVTGGQDKTAAVWDLRLPGVKLAVFRGHQDTVTVVKWAPFSRTLFCSASTDRKVHLWTADSLDSPKPLFTHSGHVTPVNDLSWNANERLLLASAAEDSVHMWAMHDELYTVTP